MYKATVIRGDGIGKKIGWPTANLSLPLEYVSFADGVYAGGAVVRGKHYDAAVVLDRDVHKVEVHLLNYDGDDCYDEEIILSIYEQVSKIENIAGQDLLVKIQHDIDAVRDVLAKE